MNALEKFWSLFSRNRIAQLQYENKLLRAEVEELKQEHTAEIADIVRRHRASMQKQADDYCAGLDVLTESLAKLHSKGVCDETHHQDC